MALLVFMLAVLTGSNGVWAESNIDDTNKYAWSENAGWMNFKAMTGTYGVSVGTECLYGYVWAENIGWIHLGQGSCPYPDPGSQTASHYGVKYDGSGNCSGYGWSETAGWINFNPTHGGVTIETGTPPRNFDGYAWGENIGYIHFQNDSPAYMVQQAGPTAVELVSFTAEACEQPVCVLLRWQTATEIDTAGFHLWRGEDEYGEFHRFTDGLIPAEGTSSMGALYTHEDTDVTPGMTYWYKLEDIEHSGASTFHGAVKVEMQPALCGTLPNPKRLSIFSLILLTVATIFWWRRRRGVDIE